MGKKAFVLAAVAALFLYTVELARATTYPTQPINVVVALSPGGVADVLARALGQRLHEELGQPVIVENRTGGNTQVAAGHVAKSEPDGYVLLLTPEYTFTVNPHLYKGQAETVNALTPVSGLATTALALVINPKIPASDIRGLIEYAKANPGKINFGVPGIGSISHLATEQFQAQAGVKLNSVSYRGAAPAISDLIAGHIDAMFIAVGLVRGPAGAGKLKLLGIGSASRLEKMADLPTISETLPGFESTIWFGLFAPKGTPSEIVDKLNNVVQRIVSNPEFNAKYMAPNLFVPIPGKPSALSQTIEQQSARWKKVIGSSGIKVSQ